MRTAILQYRHNMVVFVSFSFFALSLLSIIIFFLFAVPAFIVSLSFLLSPFCFVFVFVFVFSARSYDVKIPATPSICSFSYVPLLRFPFFRGGGGGGGGAHEDEEETELSRQEKKQKERDKRMVKSSQAKGDRQRVDTRSLLLPTKKTRFESNT